MSQERALISGSHGFIGEHLVARLEAQQFEVIRGDREGNCPQLVDYIFDLAGYGNMPQHSDIEEIYKANVDRLMNLLKNTSEYPYKRFVVTSTNAVILKTLTHYSTSKLWAEFMGATFARDFDKTVIAIRPFTIIGVGEQREHLIPTLIRSCMEDEEMPFVREPVHDFIDVEDVVSAYILASEKAKKFQIFEAGSGISYSNQEVRLIVEEIIGQQANLRYVDRLREYDTTKWVADNNSLLDLGWKPQKKLRQTISEMVEGYGKCRT